MNRPSLSNLFGSRRSLHFHLALVVAVVLVWGHSLSFGLVWDDAYFIQDHQAIRSLLNIPSMFWSLDAQSSYPEGFVLFRPLRTALYSCLYTLGGLQIRPWLFHFNNLVWHTLTVVLFHQLLRQLLTLPQLRPNQEQGSDSLLRAEWIAFVAALGFAVHPVVSEVVCWSKSLDDMMAASFTLGSAAALLRWTPSSTSIRPYWTALALFVLALYSKISAAPFAVAAFLMFLFIRRESLVRSLKFTAPFAAASVLFLIHRHLVIGRTSQAEPLSGTYVQTLIDTVAVVPAYLRLAAGVPPFCIDYSFLPSGHALLSTPVLLGTFLFTAQVLVSFICLRRPARAVAGFGLAWGVLFMLPASNLIPTMQYMAERFLYLPLLGCLMAAAGILLHVRAGSPRMTLAISFSAVVLWSALAWNRSWIWQDEVTLFLQTSAESPSKRVENNAVNAVFKLPQLRHVYKTVSRPGRVPALVMQDEDSLLQADWAQIDQSLAALSQVFPTNTTVLTARGFAAARTGNLPQAVAFFKSTTQSAPDGAIYWRNLGLAQFQSGNPGAAERSLQTALRLSPDDLPALKTLSGAYWQQEKFSAARQVLLRLRQLEPANPEHAHWLKEAEHKLEGSASEGQ